MEQRRMTTPPDSASARLAAADSLMLRLVDQALDQEGDEDALSWLLSRLPVEQHPRASRLLLAAQAPTAEGEATARVFVDTTSSRWVGQRVGPYKLESLIGEGGMGQVFLAARADGEFSQQVAVKLIRNASLTDQAIGLFHSERQILANLQHPNIARLLDGGTTGSGVPYVVMEYVEGEPLDLYLEANALSLQARVELFIDICAAVDHAHRALVIHRDIKPANILVTAAGVPKLLDFGVAKSIQRLDAEAQATVDGRMLTPSYASPEQVQGMPLTTATDVYSLGVVLYQCLTGERPYETSSLSPAQYEQVVTEQVPELPSRRVQGRDGGDWQALSGDLDAIVLQAMAKEPDRRYASATALADDLRRYLAHMPVAAQPDRLGYRLRRFVKRRLGWVVSGAIAGALLLGACGLIFAQYRVALTERERAELRFNQARQLAKSMFYDVYDKLADVQGTLAARETLASVGVAYLDELASDPIADADLLLDMGKQYSRLSDVYGGLGIANLGQPEQSWQLLIKAEALIAQLLEQQPDNIEAVAEMLWLKRLKTNQLLSYQLDSVSAKQEILAALEMADRVREEAVTINWALESRYWNARTDYVKVLLWDNDHETALRVLDEYLSEIDQPFLRSNLRNAEGKRIYLQSLRADLHLDAGRFAQALPDWKAAFAYISEQFAQYPQRSYYMIQRLRYAHSLGKTYVGLQQWEPAIEYAQVGTEMADRLLALDSSDKGAVRNRAQTLATEAAALVGLQRFSAARVKLNTVHAVSAQLLAELPEEPQYQRDMAHVRYLQGALELAMTGDSAVACGLFAESRSRWSELQTKDQLLEYDRVTHLSALEAAQQKSCAVVGL